MGVLSKLVQYTAVVKRTNLLQKFASGLQNNVQHLRTVHTLERKFEDVKFNNRFEDNGIDNVSNTQGTLQITWNDNTTCEFPHIFLRDNCQCSECFHPTSKQRLLNVVKDIDVNISTEDVHHCADEDAVVVHWPDNHKSVYPGSWLRERKFPNSWEEATTNTSWDIRPRVWNSSTMSENLPFIDYEKLMSCDNTLVTYLENLFIYGLSIIQNAPLVSGLLYDLPKRISVGYLKTTNYGKLFTVKSKPSPSNLAYTAEALPLHVDLPFYSYQPNFQFLHCIEQSEGENSGTSLLNDGFRAAEELRNTNPHFFDLLTQVKFKFNDIGTDEFGEYDLQYERPIIGLDSFDNLETISFNNHVRSSFINAPSAKVLELYKAYYALTERLNSDALEYKMAPGDIICFNNKRVLHGRKSFDVTKTTRWLEGAYMDHDELSSSYRVVKDKVANREMMK